MRKHKVKLPSGWNELTWEQIRMIHETPSRFPSTMVWKLHIWLELQGMELCNKSYFQESLTSQRPYVNPDMSIAQMNKAIDATIISKEPQEGDPVAVCIWRRKRKKILHSGNEELFGSPLAPMIAAIDKHLSWMADDKLIQLPKSSIRIGWHRYKLPDPLFSNISYEQFSNCQHALQEYWQTLSQAEKMRERIKQPNHKMTDEEKSDIDKMLQELHESRAQFLAHLLIPQSFQVWKKNGDGTSLSLKWIYEYDSRNADKIAKRMMKAPQWLFDICLRMFQDSLSVYEKEYTYLFSSSGGSSSKSNPLVLEVRTLNAVMIKGGYTTQTEVYNSNAVCVFDLMNLMAQEAEEMKKAQSKAQSKRK